MLQLFVVPRQYIHTPSPGGRVQVKVVSFAVRITHTSLLNCSMSLGWVLLLAKSPVTVIVLPSLVAVISS